MEFSPVRWDKEALAAYRELFFTSFSPQSKFETRALEWLYAKNPDGHVIGFDAILEGQLAAHYACIPTTVEINGVQEKALLSLNTATHPTHQGKGLFTALATKTYEAAAALGFASVHGVANANSTPGFVRRLGFQLVRPLDAMVGIGRLKLDADTCSRETLFRRCWSPAALQWRCANPANAVALRQSQGWTQLRARGPSRLVSAYAELPITGAVPSGTHAPGVANLFLGLVPSGAGRFRSYAHIPRRLRPSPLNLIFRDLTGRNRVLDPERVFFSFLDFDAY